MTRIVTVEAAKNMREGAESCWEMPWSVGYNGEYLVLDGTHSQFVAIDMLEEVAELLVAAPDLAFTVEQQGRRLQRAERVIAECREHEQPCNCWMFAFDEPTQPEICQAANQAPGSPTTFYCLLPTGHNGDHRGSSVTWPNPTARALGVTS